MRGAFVNRVIYTLGIVFAVILVLITLAGLTGAFYKVRSHQQAVIYQFGAPQRLVTPGVRLKIPFIQDIRYCDMRAHNMYLPNIDALMAGKAKIRIDATVQFEVADCLEFVRINASEDSFREDFETSLIATVRKITPKYTLDDLSRNEDKFFKEVQARLAPIAGKSAAKLLGVNLYFTKR